MIVKFCIEHVRKNISWVFGLLANFIHPCDTHLYFRQYSCWRRAASLSTAPVRWLWPRTKNRSPGPFRCFPAFHFSLRWERQSRAQSGARVISSAHSLFLRSPTSEQKACREPGCRRNSCASSRGSAPSWAGTPAEQRPLSPTEPTGTPLGSLSPSSWKPDQGACFGPHEPASVGCCWQKTLVFLPRHSCSLETAGHVGISSVNTGEEGGMEGARGDWVNERWLMQQCRCCHDNSDDSASAAAADWLHSRAWIRK